MKQIVVLLMIFFVIAAEAAVEDGPSLHSLIEPPMELSQELPITLSQANKQAFIDNPNLLDAEAEHNAAFLKSKTFPLITLISILIVTLAIFFIRLLPSETTEEKIDPQIKEKNERGIKEALRKLLSIHPQDANERTDTILQIDFLLRRYLQNKYEFPAFSYTAQELGSAIEALPELKEGMKKIFEVADKIKFAEYTPSPSDLESIAPLIALIKTNVL